MRKAIVVFVGLAIGVFAWQMVAADAAATDQDMNMRAVDNTPSISSSLVMQKMNLQPLAFTENQGQWDERVLFRANAGGATMWFTNDGAYYQFTKRVLTPQALIKAVFGGDKFTSPHDRFDHEQHEYESMMIKASFVGANPTPELIGDEPMEYKCNYFIGNDPSEWHANVPNYQAVVYKDVYDGIDLKYYGNGKQMEYDFIVSPGADPSQILVEYENAKSVIVNESGELVVETDWGNVIEHKPLVYQVVDDERQLVECEYALIGDNVFSFYIPLGYDVELALVIDPALSYSTYLGGSGQEHRGAIDIALAPNGEVVVCGHTTSSDFPIKNAIDPVFSSSNVEAFVTRMGAGCDTLIFSTYLGGAPESAAYGIAVDTAGNVYVTGYTCGDFPTTPGAYNEVYNGWGDVFVAKLSPEGSLIYSTYIGGAYIDEGKEIAVDSQGSAYIAGHTSSFNYPTVNPYDSDYNYDGVNRFRDVFLSKLNASGSDLIYSTYLGGVEKEELCGIALLGNSYAIITGNTYSQSFPTTLSAYDTSYNGYGDVFVTRFSPSGASLDYSTFAGGDTTDDSGDIDVDAEGNAYIIGQTWSADFPTHNAFDDQYHGNNDAFVFKLSSSGSDLLYSTFLGDELFDRGADVALSSSGELYVCGLAGAGFPVLNAFDSTLGSTQDLFLAKLSSSGTSLIFSTYFGGSVGEQTFGLVLDNEGNIYLSGVTSSYDFPTTPNAFDTSYNGNEDGFIMRIENCSDPDWDWICDADDNCPLVFNPDQVDSDSDGVGDVCDICPNHPEDDCCNPTEGNLPPEITSPDEDSAIPGVLFEYTAAATDPNCDGTELVLSFDSFPSWCDTIEDTIFCFAECDYVDTSFVVIASDGELADTQWVLLTIDKSNVAPIITDPTDPVFVKNGCSFVYYPSIDDPDDTAHSVTYLDYPHWCDTLRDTVSGVAPDECWNEPVQVVVKDYCGADTLIFGVPIYLCGDADGNCIIEISDAVYLINYVFVPESPAPDPYESGDADCSGVVEISDAVYLINYIFVPDSPAPCDPDGDGEPDC